MTGDQFQGQEFGQAFGWMIGEAGVRRVAIANLRQMQLIAEAWIKTDVIDATVLTRFYASGFLPGVWTPTTGRWACAGKSRAAPRSCGSGRG